MSEDSCAVHHAFVTVGNREVHYRRLGSGPAALFIHSSPTNSSYVLGDMRAQADRYTCYAFDTPGFGLSDPLPQAELTVADLVAATVEAMAALSLPPVPVFGTHTGAAIALELGYRHPELVTGLVLEGVPIFTKDEINRLEDIYFAPLTVDPLGGHYSNTWTRYRDQYRWFPWYARAPEAINEIDLGEPDDVHRWTQMFFASAEHYKKAYSAAIAYCEGAVQATLGLRVPVVFTAERGDMLHAHLDRLPPLRDGQRIVQIVDLADKYQLTRDSFAIFGSGGTATLPPEDSTYASSAIRRRFVAVNGRNLLARHAGDPAAPALILLHDVPGSAWMIRDRVCDQARDHFVIAPDIPGSGESEGLAETATMADYAAVIWRLCDELGISQAAIEGIGFGASLAVEMAATQPDRSCALTIDGLFLPDEAERAHLLARLVPEITVEPDGAHWYRLWLRLRDSLIYWPWYDTRQTALRRVAGNFGARHLHDWTVETMKQWPTQHYFPRAAMRHDAASRLREVIVPVRFMADSSSPFAAAFGDRLEA